MQGGEAVVHFELNGTCLLLTQRQKMKSLGRLTVQNFAPAFGQDERLSPDDAVTFKCYRYEKLLYGSFFARHTQALRERWVA